MLAPNVRKFKEEWVLSLCIWQYKNQLNSQEISDIIYQRTHLNFHLSSHTKQGSYKPISITLPQQYVAQKTRHQHVPEGNKMFLFKIETFSFYFMRHKEGESSIYVFKLYHLSMLLLHFLLPSRKISENQFMGLLEFIVLLRMFKNNFYVQFGHKICRFVHILIICYR